MMNQQLRSFLWAVATAATFVTTQLLLATLLRHLEPNSVFWTAGLGQMVVSAGALLVAAALIAFLHREDLTQWFSVPRTTPRLTLSTIVVAFVMGLSLQFPLAELANNLQVFFPQSQNYFLQRQQLLQWHTLPEFLLASVTVAGIVPCVEEFVFRGLILRKLSKDWPTTWAIVLSALCFAVAHLDPVALVYAFFAGCLIGWSYYRTFSLGIAISVHAGVNWLPILLEKKIISIRGFNTISSEIQHINPWLVASSLFVCALSTYAMHRMIPPRRNE